MNPLSSKTKTKIWVVESGTVKSCSDRLTAEEPLEIRLVEPEETIAVTMRTPGADFDLVAGFLFNEGIIGDRSDIQQMSYCVDLEIDGAQRQNIVNVALKAELRPDLHRLERHFFTNSACGVCGKANIEALQIRGFSPLGLGLQVGAEVIYSLPERLRAAQNIFKSTGGLHAAAIFDSKGELWKLREDVGRHNALDKLIGSALLAGELPLGNNIVMVSGRSSYEILQKCLVAGAPIICAVSAPSSLAVSLAREFNITLIGFLRGNKFNVYSGIERIDVR